MANQKGHSDLLEVVNTGLGALASIAEQHEILSAVMNEIPKEMWRPAEAEDFCSLVDEVKSSYEDLRSRLTDFRGILKGEDEGSTDGCAGSNHENVEEQFMQKVSEFMNRLFVLFTEVMSMTMIPGSKEVVISYEEFKSCLDEGINDHTFQKVMGAILGRIDAHKEQVKQFGSSVQKEKGRKVDDLLNKVLESIHLVGFLVTEIGREDQYETNPFGNPKECEESLKEIMQMINALKAE